MLEAMDVGPEGPRPAVGQFSYQQLSYWEATTPDPWVIATLTQGYKLQFRRRPPAFKGVRMTVVSDPNSSLALRQEVAQLLEKGAIEPVDWSERLSGFFSIYFIIPKKDGGVRPILDLRGLNKFLKILPFRMLRITDVLQAVKQQHWFTTVDLKDAYFHVPIAPQHRPFLRFAFQDQVYQFRVLPFGLSLSPRVFTRCMAAALAPIQARGLQVLPYLDDWLLCSHSQEQAVLEITQLLAHITRLGLSVNFSKSRLTPSQSVRFLGLTLDSRSMKAVPSEQRVDNILLLLQRFRRQARLPFRCFLRLTGMLAAAAAVIPLGLLSLRPFQIWVNSLHLNPSWHRNRLIKVSQRCLLALNSWRSRLYLTKGVVLGMIPSRREIVQTDASLTGWGAVWQHRAVTGQWGPQEVGENINTLELRAVLRALKHLAPFLKGRHILVRSDNKSVVYHINHQGGTRSSQSLQVSQELLTWAFPRFASIRAMHIPGVSNVVPDFLSRHRIPSTEWRLNPEVVEMIWQRFGRAEVDLFASATTTHCRLWFSLAEESSPLGQDALAHAWPDRLLYAFPPIPMIGVTVHRVLQEHHRLLLVAPNWPGRPWFPVMYRLLDGVPWTLPKRKDLLQQLEGQIWHPNPDRLQLCVWPLRGRNHSLEPAIRGSRTPY
jgi:hypothetical protein